MTRMISRGWRRAARGALVAASTLSGCAPLLIGGAIVGSSMVATDRRTSGAQVEDQAIEFKAAKRAGDILGERGHANVTSYNGIVLLTGEVPERGRQAGGRAGASRASRTCARSSTSS